MLNGLRDGTKDTTGTGGLSSMKLQCNIEVDEETKSWTRIIPKKARMSFLIIKTN